MPISYRIDAANGIVFAEAHGHVTGDELLDYQKRLREDPDFRGSYRHLVDARHLDRIVPSMSAIRQLAEGVIFETDARQAYVVESDVAVAGIAVFRALATTPYGNVEVFRDLAKAREWLGC